MQKKSEKLTKSVLELISNYSKIVEYMINIQKSITFLMPTINKWNLKLKTIPFTSACKEMKYLCTNITKYI